MRPLPLPVKVGGLARRRRGARRVVHRVDDIIWQHQVVDGPLIRFAYLSPGVGLHPDGSVRCLMWVPITLLEGVAQNP